MHHSSFVKGLNYNYWVLQKPHYNGYSVMGLFFFFKSCTVLIAVGAKALQRMKIVIILFFLFIGTNAINFQIFSRYLHGVFLESFTRDWSYTYNM